MKLYELTANYNQVLELIEEGADPEVMNDTLEAIEGEIESKVDNTAMVLKTVEANIKALKDEEKRLADRRKSLENQNKRLKEYLHDQLKSIGMKKVKGTIFSANIQNNPPSLNITDETKIPEEYWVQPSPSVNKKELLEKIKNGEEIEGAEIKQTESLRIR
jgi:hypothetical protein